MFAVTGITGQVGGSVARKLLAAGKSVRAVVRDTAKAVGWAQQDCDVLRADINDVGGLSQAFYRIEGVFVLLPRNFDPSPGFPEARQIIAAVRKALEKARPPKVVCLFHNRSSGNSTESSDAIADHGEGTWHVVDANHLSAGRLVHREFVLGCSSRPQHRYHSQFSAAIGQTIPLWSPRRTSDGPRPNCSLIVGVGSG